MIDRRGYRVAVGYSAHEILWLRAAISTGRRRADLQDISELTGRSVECLRQMSYKIREADRLEEKAARIVKALAAAPKPPVRDDVPSLSYPTMAQLMSGSTRVRTYNGWTT